MEALDKKVWEISALQEKVSIRTRIEREAEELISEGMYLEAEKLLDRLNGINYESSN